MNAQLVQDRPLESITCEAPIEAADRLIKIRLVPWGKVESKRGVFIVDDQAAASIVRTFEQHKTDLVVDFEHATLDANGLAPAAGWVKSMSIERGVGVFGLVEWNQKARDMIRAGEYRFLSPVVVLRRNDRHAVRLHSIGLVNLPAIAGQDKLAASERFRNILKELRPMAEENRDDRKGTEPQELLERMRKVLGMEGAELPALFEAALLRLEALGDDAVRKDSDGTDAAVAASVRKTLGLPENSSADAIALARAVRQGAGAAATELQAMRDHEAERVANERVETYLSAHRLNPRDEEGVAAARRLARFDPVAFESIMKGSLPFCPVGRTVAPNPSETGRTMVISSARAEFQADATIGKATSMQAFCNLRLRESGLELLSDEEARDHSLIAV